MTPRAKLASLAAAGLLAAGLASGAVRVLPDDPQRSDEPQVSTCWLEPNYSQPDGTEQICGRPDQEPPRYAAFTECVRQATARREELGMTWRQVTDGCIILAGP